MSKRNKGNASSVPTAQPTAAPASSVPTFTVVAPKRPLTGTKHGNGTAATHQLLADAAAHNGGTLTGAEAAAICKAAGDPGFYRYAVNRLRVLVPVAAQQAPVAAATQQVAA